MQPGDERSFAYVAATRGTDLNMIRVVTDTLDDEPAGHHPERTARDVLGDVLANEPAVTAGEALTAAAAHQCDAAEMFNRYRHTTRTIAEHTLAGVLDARGAGQLLDAPDAWQLIDETERVTERGLDPATILTAASDEQLAEIVTATSVLRQARLYPDGPPPPYPTLVAGLVSATSPTTQPDVAAYLDGLAAGLAHRRDTLAAQYGEGPIPAWATRLGPPPEEPQVRAQWADAIAKVGLWREAHRVNGDDPVGRPLPPGHRDRPARARAEMAAAHAIELATGNAADRSRPATYRPSCDPAPVPAPTREHGPHLSR